MLFEVECPEFIARDGGSDSTDEKIIDKMKSKFQEICLMITGRHISEQWFHWLFQAEKFILKQVK